MSGLSEDTTGEAREVYLRALRSLPGERMVEKAFELTEITRQTMRAGLRARYPDESEQQIQRRYVDCLLQCHGWSLEKIAKRRREEAARPPIERTDQP